MLPNGHCDHYWPDDEYRKPQKTSDAMKILEKSVADDHELQDMINRERDLAAEESMEEFCQRVEDQASGNVDLQ
jgi:hypothetical protein